MQKIQKYKINIYIKIKKIIMKKEQATGSSPYLKKFSSDFKML